MHLADKDVSRHLPTAPSNDCDCNVCETIPYRCPLRQILNYKIVNVPSSSLCALLRNRSVDRLVVCLFFQSLDLNMEACLYGSESAENCAAHLVFEGIRSSRQVKISSLWAPSGGAVKDYVAKIVFFVQQIFNLAPTWVRKAA